MANVQKVAPYCILREILVLSNVALVNLPATAVRGRTQKRTKTSHQIATQFDCSGR
jgi:hypothetical protein